MTAVSEAVSELRKAGVKRIRLMDFFKMYRVDGENFADYIQEHPGDIDFKIGNK